MHLCRQRTASKHGSSDTPRSSAAPRSAHDLPPILRMQRAIGNRAVNRLIQRQFDVKFDPCVVLPNGRKVCGSDAVSACEKAPGIPGCSTVCKLLGCKKSNKPAEKCVAPWRTATSKDFIGQCCLGPVDRKETCCPPDRVALSDFRCCVGDEVVVDDKCVKSSDIPPGPLDLCLPGQRTTTGQCCTLPLVPEGPICVVPKPPAPPTPPPAPPIPKPFEIFFNFDRPNPGESASAGLRSSATAEGVKNFDALVAALRADSTLRVHLTGKTSPEGDAGHNLALGERRARLVKAALIEAGIDSSRLADPPSGSPAGCDSLETGVANCHMTSSSGPLDRQTRAQVFR
jgi:hypothetical protein